MEKHYHKWYSHRVELEMPLIVYGSYGIPLIVYPTASSDHEEAEREGIIGCLAPFIDAGRIKVFCIDSINRYSWGNADVHPGHKSYLTQKYDEYITEEVVPLIYNECRGKQSIVATGASMGAFFAANTFLKHPDVIDAIICMHGVYDLSLCHGDYNDQYCYQNNPVAYLPNLNDDYYLPLLRSKSHIYIVSSRGMWEQSEYSKQMSDVLHSKQIHHQFDVWDEQWPHDWPSWRVMLPQYLEKVLQSYGA